MNKRINKAWVRFISALLATCILTGITGSNSTWGGIISLASTELQEEDLDNMGRSNATAYKIIRSGDTLSTVGKGWGGPSYRFDLKGINDGQTESDYDSAGIEGTYSNEGVSTYLAMAGKGRTSPPSGWSDIPRQAAPYDPASVVIKTKDHGEPDAPDESANYFLAKLGQRDKNGNLITTGDHEYKNGAVERITFGDGTDDNPEIVVEYKMTVTPDPEKGYVVVDYYIANVGGDVPPEGRKFWLGSGFEWALGGAADIARKTARGMYVASTKYDASEMEIIDNSPELGIYDPFSTKYLAGGSLATRFIASEGDSSIWGSPGIDYSWEFNLRPNETIHRRTAFRIRPNVNYVSWAHGEDSGREGYGAFNKPYKTLEYAIGQGVSRGGDVYILVQDYKPIDKAVELINYQNLVIASSDMDMNGNTPGESVQTLSRASGYEGPLFKWVFGRNGTLRFESITLDGSGGGREPLVLVAEGYNAENLLEIGSGTSMVNNKAGAVSFESPGDLYIDGGTKGVVIKNNVSEKGAVDFSGGGTFSMKNKVIIKDNQKEGGGSANVYLPEGKHIEVDGELGESAVGITTQNIPGTSAEGSVTEAAQEIKIAAPTDKYPSFTGGSPFADNFFADLSARGDYAAPGTPGLGNNRNTVIRRSGYRLTKSYLDTSTGGGVSGKPDEILGIAQGDAVNLEPPGTVAGYRLKDVSIGQGDFKNLTADKTAGGDFGRVTGTMPGQEVTIYYEYEREPSQLIFAPNGGTPAPPVLSGLAGRPVTAKMPVISRYGYIFKGWTEDAYAEHPDIIASLPAAYPLSPKTYYAVFEPDHSVKFNLTVEYTDTAGNLLFQTKTKENAYSAEDTFAAVFKNVPNFKWSMDDSHVVPETYDYDGRGPRPTGDFIPSTGGFVGEMPAMDTVVRYVFQEDSSQPQQVVAARGYLNNGIVDWKNVDGDNIDHGKLTDDSRFDQPSRTEFPGEKVTIRPKSVYGYKVVFGFIDRGKDSFERGLVPPENSADYPWSDRFLVFGGKGSFDSEWNFTGWMPNQEFGIAYVYEPTDEGYQFTTKYLDSDTRDAKLENIVQPVIENHRAEASVSREYQEQYGYTRTGRSFAPDSAEVIWTDSTLTGRMPNEDLLVTYTHHRLPDKWAEITYKPGAKGSLQGGEGVSADVQTLAGGEFKASVLINDKTSKGRDKAYTLADIKEKRLMPLPKPESEYYRFGGWFIDADNSGKLDGDETILPQDYQFEGHADITAYFEENPDAWITIQLEAGEHGSIDTGEPRTLHITYDKKWSDILAVLPRCTPEVNYLPDGWYVQGEPMEDDMSLVKGQIYTMQFYPDPAVFGTRVSAPNAVAGLNTQAKGRVTIFGTAQGYKYILTDQTGEVLAVNKGNLLTSRTYFDGLYPGTAYVAYEATGSTRVKEGDMIGEARGMVSDAVQAVTPVVETNYQVFYDEEDEGKTQLVIKPADPASDYAVLDHAGNVVHTPKTTAAGWQKPSGNPAGLEFAGLGYNGEYTVVARPSGRNEITPESCREYGSVIAADPGGELELPNYIIETVNGEIEAVGSTAVGASRCEEAHKGDLVKITAEPEDGKGNSFSHWEFAIGSVKGLERALRQREVSFAMPDANLVLSAVYVRGASTPSSARAVYEVRGGSRDELALDPDPDGIRELEEALTMDVDRELLDVNRADVTYKVVYRKNAVRASESNAIKAGGRYNTDHQEAYKGAWGLDVSIERYVNGRRVNRASASNASFKTYVQMEKNDVDMMDYQLYELIHSPDDGSITVSEIPMDYDPEETGGLFTFTATEGGRYVMVYNRAYRLYFLNNTVPAESRYRYYFKVRRNEWPGQDCYAAEYAGVEGQPDYFVSPEGAEYNYIGWSFRPDKLRDFDPDRRITRKTYVYAFYEDNLQEVGKTREELEKEILNTTGLSDDYFLKLQESRKLKEYINGAQMELDREPKATMSYLEAALEKLKENAAPYKELLDKRYDHYDQIHENGNKGGSKGGGGGGRGTKKAPFDGTAPKSYQIAAHGSWVEGIGPSGERQLKFRMNGGSFLRGMWARLEYPGADRAAGNGWYRFDSNANVQSGWICDEAGKWYYCSTEKEGDFGLMATGWKLDKGDGNWYYLDPVSGEMALGWKKMGGKWYYFSPTGEGVYTYDPTKEIWIFGGRSGRPLGSMYKNEVTPDGYRIGADGAWIQ